MTVDLALESGEKGEARNFEDQVLVFASPRAFAPGAPIRFALVLGGNRKAFEGRCIASKRADGGHFEVRMRFVNLRREDREALVEAVATTSAVTSK